MFDHVKQAINGMKNKLNRVSQHIDSIEKRQTKLDHGVDKMIDKMKAYRELKKEVQGLNRAQNRIGGQEARNRKSRVSQKKM